MPTKPPAKSRRDTRTVWQAALAKVQADAEAKFPDNVGKLHQLDFHLKTVAMVIDDLHDTTPPAPPVNLT